MRVLLASASPRRRDLLTAAGIAHDVAPANVDETRLLHEDAATYARRVAALKATVALAAHPNRVVLAADTVVVLDDDVMGKPADVDDAARMLGALSGREHDVLTAVAVARAGHLDMALDRTRVWFRDLSADDIAWYVASGEPMDKAGAYAIQGLASRFIPRIDGSFSNVVGLPIATVDRLLRAAGAAV